MKTFIVALVLMMNLNFYSQNIQAVITYKKEISELSFKNSGKDSSYVTKRNSLFEEIFEKAYNLQYILEINNFESLFYLNEKLNLDNDTFASTAANFGGTRGVFYVNINTREVLNEKNSYGEKFLVKSSLDNHKWVITSETKKIKGYNCFKATSTKIIENNIGVFEHPIEAWFTTEIPLNFGPIDYAGLPGLILDIKFQNVRVYCSNIVLNPKNGVTIKKPTKGKLVSPKEFNEIGKEMTKYYRRN